MWFQKFGCHIQKTCVTFYAGLFDVFGLYQTESSSYMEKPAKRMHSSSNLHEGTSDLGPSKAKVCIVQML